MHKALDSNASSPLSQSSVKLAKWTMLPPYFKPFNGFSPICNQEQHCFTWPSGFSVTCALSISPGYVLFSHLIHFSMRTFIECFWLFVWICTKLSLWVSLLTLWRFTGMTNGTWGLRCAWVLMKMGPVIAAVLNDGIPFNLWRSGWYTNIHAFMYHANARLSGELIKSRW